MVKKRIFVFGLTGLGLLIGVFMACRPGGTPRPETGASGPEPHRPRFHFTPPAHWMNDPNGMFYLNGEYHLHYQYYPDSTVWGPMHWGHAVSRDLVRWEHLPVSLAPDSLGYIFSGSAVVDADNRSGFGTPDQPPVVAAFTYHDPVALEAGRKDFQSQGIAYSLDDGRNWTKYENNPVLPNTTENQDFRDPKLIWHPGSEQWVMALAVYDRVQFYGSSDLKNWAFLSEFGLPGDTRLWECPDLFPLRMPGSREEKWVLLVSIQQEGPNGGTGTSYFLGDFDGANFSADAGGQHWLDYGPDNYAFVTWDNAPVGWGSRLGIGWMSNWQYAQEVPTQSWRSAMTLPRVLSLKTLGDSLVLAALPVPSVSGLRGEATALPEKITGRKAISGNFSPSACDLVLQTDLSRTTATRFGFTLTNAAGNKLEVSFDREAMQMRVDRTRSGPGGFSDTFFKGPHTAPMLMEGNVWDVRALLDVASMELFAGEGALNFTEIFFPETPFTTLELWAEGDWYLNEGTVYALGAATRKEP